MMTDLTGPLTEEVMSLSPALPFHSLRRKILDLIHTFFYSFILLSTINIPLQKCKIIFSGLLSCQTFKTYSS